MARHNFSRVARGSRRSNKSWSGVVDVNNSIAGGSAKILLGSLVPSNVGIDETILRTVGLLHVHSDQIAASEPFEGAFGMMVVTDLASAAGAASIPGPLTDIADDGWFVHVPFSGQLAFGSGVGFDGDSGLNERFDFKSKRVVEGKGKVIALMIESSTSSGGFVFSTIIRLLSMLTGSGR